MLNPYQLKNNMIFSFQIKKTDQFLFAVCQVFDIYVKFLINFQLILKVSRVYFITFLVIHSYVVIW